jgi:DNA invertase Pin-like site-specific DNA recombinase
VQEAVLARVWSFDGQVWEVTGDMGALRDDPEDPYRRFVRQVTGAARELERNMIIARMQGGRKRKAGRKRQTGGRVPYGFERRGEGKAAVLVEVSAEQAVIKRMMRMRRRGRTLRQIATKLNADGVPAKDGGEWQHTSVRSVLRRAAA